MSILPRSILKIKKIIEKLLFIFIFFGKTKKHPHYTQIVRMFLLCKRYAARTVVRLSFEAFLETYIGFAAVLSISFCLSIQFSSFFRHSFLQGSVTNFAL